MPGGTYLSPKQSGIADPAFRSERKCVASCLPLRASCPSVSCCPHQHLSFAKREPKIDFAEMVWSFSSILHGVCQLLIISNNSATNIALPPPRATPGQQPLRVDALRQSRLFWDQTPNDLVGHHLFKRDACTQAFGAGWSGTTCLPGSTYCCVSDAHTLL